ncbi:hypothetical protein A0H81_07895 [Grifola frondosa]|uniref:Uncharacterized protein n=1 Tax=Grifola frondosa TaxID=5627 RepID=A0A1C7M6S3_GRIFR|nr:hypothetical protein A0H81_07895 [Grifola frondosa]
MPNEGNDEEQEAGIAGMTDHAAGTAVFNVTPQAGAIATAGTEEIPERTYLSSCFWNFVDNLLVEMHMEAMDRLMDAEAVQKDLQMQFTNILMDDFKLYKLKNQVASNVTSSWQRAIEKEFTW